jgi:hypothetical protein
MGGGTLIFFKKKKLMDNRRGFRGGFLEMYIFRGLRKGGCGWGGCLCWALLVRIRREISRGSKNVLGEGVRFGGHLGGQWD